MHDIMDRAEQGFGPEVIADAPTDPDAFLAWVGLREAEYEGYKVELSHGRVTKMMVNVKRGHTLVCSNLLRALYQALDPETYLISSADFGVKVPQGVRCPDVLVEPAGGDRQERASENPVFIAEVLSRSTTSIDFEEKLPEYIAIPSLQAYLICSQDEPTVWLMARDQKGAWPESLKEIRGRGGSVSIPSLGLDMPMAEIYRGIPDPH